MKNNLIYIFTILAFIAVSTANISLTELRQELTDSIRDFQLHGEPEQFDESLRHLISQLDRHQLSSLHAPISLEWESSNITTSATKQICFVVSSFEGMYINSGIGTTYYALAHQLAGQGHSVTVVYTRDEPTVGGSWAEWTQYYAKQNIQLIALPASDKQIATPKLQSTSLRVYRYLAQNPQFGVVHFGDFEAHGFYSIMAKRVSNQFVNTAFVVGLHGPTRWTLDSNTARIPTEETEIDLDYMERLSVENADAVWTPSAYIASWLSQKGWKLSSDNIHLLPLPPGPEFSSVAALSATVQPKEFVFFGRLETRKGLALFCDAIDLLNKVNKNLPKDLIVTFLGTSGFVNGIQGEKYVKARSAKWGFNVKFITNANRTSALDYLKDASAQRLPIIPSLADNAPYTVYECLYAGIPFLASDLSSISPLIANAEERATHLFQMKPHQLANVMIKAITNGVAPATPSFTVKKAEDTWTAFYSNVKPKDIVITKADVPLVTVVITYYNRPVLVKQAIASIEQQDYSNYEIVLVDDGSTDSAAIQFLSDVKAKFDSKKWKIIRGSNQYLGAARNTGARVARGQYLLFLDDDNTFAPTAISSYVRAAKRTGAKVVTAGHSVFSGASAPSKESTMRYWVPLGASLASGLFKNTFGDANFFVERSAFLAIGGFTEEKGVGLEEHEFFAKAVFAGQKLEVVPDMLLNYRYHNEKHQMLYTTDIRLGEVRRLRPYLSALTTPTTVSSTTTTTSSDDSTHTVSVEAAHMAKKSLVHLVARNAVTPRSQSCNGTVTSVSPSSGTVLGGTSITITGSGFNCGVSKVTVDGNECSGVDITSNTELSCYTPSGSNVYNPVDIVVVISGDSITLRSSYTYQPAPAPFLRTAVLQQNGDYVLATFSSPTNRGGSARSATGCSKLLDAATLALVGSADCAFVDDSSFSINLGSDAILKVGDNITVPAGAVRGKGPGGVANVRTSVQVTVESNQTLITPVVSIKTATVVASCEGITLDASSSIGSGGRTFVSVQWSLISSVNASQASIDAVTAALANASEYRVLSITVAANQVDVAAQYSFSLTLTNWLDSNSTGSVVVKKSTYDVPTVSIAGNSLVKTFKSDALSLVGSSKGLACAGQSSTPNTFAWTVSPSVSGLTGTSDSTLSVPAGTLSAATTYTFTLTVTTSEGVSNSANVTVIVDVRALIVSLTGAAGQYAYNATVILDASASSDPENLAALTFVWSCKTALGSSCSSLALTSDSVQSFPASSLGAGTYTVTVTVSGAANRTASASTTFTITAIPFLSISISMDSTTAIPVDKITSLYGAVTQSNVAESDVAWQWTIVSGDIESTDPYQGTTSKTLVINANVLAAGSTYTYKLTAIHVPSGITGTATITFTTQQQSNSGKQTCAKSLTGGNTYSDLFSWDFGDAWALSSTVNKFQVFYNYADSVVKIPAIAPNTSVSTVTSHLPVGTILSFATAKSSSGSTASINCSVTISQADIATINADIVVANNFYDLTREIFSVFKSKTSSSSDFFTARHNILSAISRNLNTKSLKNLFNNDEFILVPADVAAVANIANGQLALSDIVSTGSLLFQTLVISISSRQNAASTDAYLQAIGNIAATNTLLTTQLASVRAGAQQSRSANDDDLSTSVSQFQNPSTSLSDPYTGVTTVEDAQVATATSSKMVTSSLVEALPTGVMKTIITDLITYSYEKNVPSNFDSTGISMGVGATITVPAGFVPTSVMKDNYITIKVSEWSSSPFSLPEGATLVSKAITVEGIDSNSSDVNFGAQPVTVVVPASKIQTASSGTSQCAYYKDGNWTTDGATTTTSATSTTCTYPTIATFAIVNSASGLATSPSIIGSPAPAGSEEKKGSSSVGGIVGGVVGGVVGAAVIAIAAAYGVRRYRAGQAGARPAPQAGPRGGASSAGAFVDAPVDPIFMPVVQRTEPSRPAVASAVPGAEPGTAALRHSMGVPPVLFGYQAGTDELARAVNIASPRSDTSSQFSNSSAGSASSRGSSRYSGRSDTSEENMEAEIRNIVGELTHQLPRNARELENLGEQLDME